MSQNKIVDPIEFQHKVSQENKNLMKDFLVEKKSQNKAKGTLKQYENDMRIILTLIYRHFDNKGLLEMSRKDIRNLSIMFKDMGMSNARVNRLLSCFRSALEYFADDDELEYDFNQGSKVKGLPKNPVREITFLSEDQIYWLKDKLIEQGKTLIAVYLMLSYISAARKNEIHQVLKDGLVERFFTNTVVGKRGKKFKLYYNDETQDLIKKYLIERGEDDISELFVNIYANGRKELVSTSTFNNWCDYMSDLLFQHEGKRIHINPHCFRHSILQNLSSGENKRGVKVPIEKLKTLANHSDISTTASYLDERNEDDIAEIFGMDASVFKD
jgi:integrase/recombinase XerD